MITFYWTCIIRLSLIIIKVSNFLSLNYFIIVQGFFIIVYHIAATTLDEAVDIWIENYSDITWKDKTREDFTRKDYWEAWIDHNREKTYNVYLNKISKLKRKLSKSMIEIPGISHIGKPCVLLKSKL